MAHDVFICHSAKDKTTADAVCAMLESSGIRCWIAPRDVTAGMEWSECIIDAIEECRVMVLVFTTNANESPQIRREVERAVNRGVAILPMRIEDILPGRALEYFIGNVHWLDAMTPPLESHLQNLAGTVKILLGRLPRHDTPIPHAAVISADAIPQVDPTPQRERTQERIVIPQQTEIPQTHPVQQIALERSARTQPAPLPTPQQIPVERAPELSSKATRKTAEAPPASPAKTSAEPKQKRAIGIVVIAIVVFLFSTVGGAGVIHDSIYGRFQTEAELGFLLCASGLAASYGLITKKSWGRILQIIFSAACIVWLLTLSHDAFTDNGDVMLWLFGFGFSAFAIRYMLTARVKQEFTVAAAERQKHFASNFAPTSVSTGPAAAGTSGIASGISAGGTGRRPTAVLVVAILSFVEAGIWIIPISQDIGRNRLEARDFGAFLLVCAAAAIGFGLIKMTGWARLLKVVVAAVDAVLMISVSQDAFHQGGAGEVMWIAIFIYIIWSAWFLFAPRMKGAFRKAA
jgi:hypothetical protein